MYPIKGGFHGTSLYEYAKSKFTDFKDNDHIIDINYLLKLLEEHRNRIKRPWHYSMESTSTYYLVRIYKDKIVLKLMNNKCSEN